ncbi:NAD synthetase / Glutamine amidotransferase chain of NAD synthetase [hydrothermal vent metagenome]|uniref:NAD(+) synthase (glutamine-hydrolyzing) n=1 Tax=hydrothermal vent metagenome TaxID=652676 RepID=A0A3B1ALZ9_9ZZZZ
MPHSLRIVMAQIDLLVGDIDGNAGKVIAAAATARDELKAQAIVFPELTLSGYPPEDLLLRPGFNRRITTALAHVTEQVHGIDVIIGYPRQTEAGLYNAASLLRDGAVAATCDKFELPNYSVFDEKRYFVAGNEPCVVEIAGVPVGITICEDIWYPQAAHAAKVAGARLLVNLNASPFHLGKRDERIEALHARTHETGLPVLYVNLVGGQDELVFDGASLVMNADGSLAQRAPAFVDDLYPADFTVADDGCVDAVQGTVCTPVCEEESIYKALVLGVRDYIEKNGFPGAIIGLSGGIDSALTLAVAVDAIGAERVEAVMMPSRYTLDISLTDARAEAETLGVEYHVLPIEPAFNVFLDILKDEFATCEPDTTEENIQARCRAVLLMAISNKKHKVVLSTGNKSEVSVGYSTLYGDMAGGFDVLKDVPKTLVYRLSEYRNRLSRVIPQRVIERPPSAELAPDQKDSDSLPSYDVLDAILEMYVEQDRCAEEIVAAGYDTVIVDRVIRLVNRNEYKRRQAAPGVRITRRAFGRDRRYPITSGYDRR